MATDYNFMGGNSCLTHLECTKSGERYNADELQNLSDEGVPLWACYDFDKVKETLTPENLAGRPNTMWRYLELLPVRSTKFIVTLGEGWTPLRRPEPLRTWSGFSNLYVKDESLNPTGSFKARGISSALSAALERGAKSFSIPSAGNAGGALAAYAAAAGVKAHVFMPQDAPFAFKVECDYYGAEVELIDGLLSDCAQIAAEKSREHGWYEVSTLKEPYRLEGKKTMGFEIAEQFNWNLPDVIIYPTGGGTGLIGMWKAFRELKQMGWIEGDLPRMVSVQSKGCAPIVRAFNEGKSHAEQWEGAETIASGIRVPGALGDFLMLDILRESGGTAIAVSDEEILECSRLLAKYTGIFPAPEGGATLAALLDMKENRLVGPDEEVVLYNTGSGFKYLEALSKVQKDAMRTALA